MITSASAMSRSRSGRARVIDFECDALLAEIIAAETKALLRIGLGSGERTEAARIGAVASLQLDDVGAERSEQQAGEFPALVADFDHADSGERGTQKWIVIQMTSSSLSAAISSG